MLEIVDRGGLGRTGVWTRGEREVRTPLILYVQRPSHPAPPYAESLLVQERTEDSRLQIRLSGSYFSPTPSESAEDLPPTKGLPFSVADLEVPQSTVAGDLAVVTNESDLRAVAAGELVFFANGPEYLRSPRAFVSTLVQAREILGPSKLLAVTGLAVPSNLAALVYAGVDLIDSSRVVLDSARGIFHTSDGALPEKEAERGACACPACEAGQDLRAHNERALYREMLLVRNHLAHGRLRELVERRLANDPWNTAVVRHFDLRHFDAVEAYTPVAGGEMLAYSHESLTRPEILRFRRRIRERYSKPSSARVLLLLPCSARKPYSRSRSHRRFRDAILVSRNPSVVHEVVVTSPLGLIPRELEHFYPARAYDIPVTGDWNKEEAAMVIDDLRSYVEANRYEAIVAHLGAEAAVVKEALPQAVFTSDGKPAADGSLGHLTKTLSEITASLPHAPRGQRFAEEMSNVARFQFGDVGRALVEGTTFRGRFPEVHVLRDGAQVAMYTERGLLSLTLEGGKVLSEGNAYCVDIEDFLPKGNVFAVGVTEATRDIRVGDDVVVRHGAEVRAVGTARMNWREMIDSDRGEAVRVRHAVEVPPKP
ncbi:MAG: archaeosine synthase subunit alpha [Thermoplasmata archaeon]